MLTTNPVHISMARPTLKRPAAPRFGHQHQPTPQQQTTPTTTTPVATPAAKKGAPTKMLHWLLSGVLGLGVVGSVAQNQNLRNDVQNQHNQFAAQLAEKDQTIAGLVDKVNALGGRTSLDQIVNVVNKVTPATVRVEGAYGLGSGVIFKDKQGRHFILTNGHVTDQNDKDGVYHIKIYNGSDYKKPLEFDAPVVRLANGAKAESSPYAHDLAVLQIPPDFKLPEGFQAVEMRDITVDPLKVGEATIAVGNPYGNRDSVSSGIISHIDREFDLEAQNRFIQTDTPINPGNSGGGLFDMQGRLIGINTLGYRGADGLGGSIRIDVIKAVLEGWGIPVLADGEKVADLKHFETTTAAQAQKAEEKKADESK